MVSPLILNCRCPAKRQEQERANEKEIGVVQHVYEAADTGAVGPCTLCGQVDPSGASCPEARVYAYGQWPSTLYTKTQLREKSLVVPLSVRPAGCYLRKTMKPPVIYLYNIATAVPPRLLSEAQAGALTAGREEYQRRHTCRVCGHYQGPRAPNVRSYSGEWLSLVEDGLCGRCETRLAAEDRAAEILALDPVRVKFFDTETTGLNKTGRDEIIESSMIDATGACKLTTLVATKDPHRQDLASHIHGITREKLSGAPLFPDICAQIVEELLNADVVVVYNASYDRMMLKATSDRYGLKIPQGITWECASNLFARWYGEWSRFDDFKCKSQEVACIELGVERVEEGAHRAEYDCRLTLGVLKAMAARSHARHASQVDTELATVAVEPGPAKV